MHLPEVIDLHMHTTVSDGTDTPEQIIDCVKQEGIELFSVTDHDAVAGSAKIKQILSAGSPQQELLFLTGIEFSCRDDKGKYHILGYHYDETSEVILKTVERGHEIRIQKVHERLDFLKEQFGMTFAQQDIDQLLKNQNPGKPHIAKMMIRYGYAETIRDAMVNYLNKKKFPNAYLLPQEAIEAILGSGGIPVLAHPSFGDGDQLITGAEMEARLKRLIGLGVEGVEAYYSGFSPKLQNEMLSFASRFGLYVTAGSDYHGANKMVPLKDTNLDRVSDGPPELKKFLEKVLAFTV